MTVGDIADGISSYMYGNGKADYIFLTEGVTTISKISSMLIGFLVAIILVGLPLVIAIEVCYINFPVFQYGYDKIHNRLKGKPARTFGLVIRDAQRAVRIANTSENGESVNAIYLKIKIKAVFICFFIVAMVLGPGVFLVNQAMLIVDGILHVKG